MKRYYLKALGSVCYDKTGMTYPDKIQCPFTELVKEYGAKSVRWIYNLGLRNQPKVLAFTASEKIKTDIDYAIKNHFCVDGVVSCEKNW